MDCLELLVFLTAVWDDGGVDEWSGRVQQDLWPPSGAIVLSVLLVSSSLPHRSTRATFHPGTRQVPVNFYPRRRERVHLVAIEGVTL